MTWLPTLMFTSWPCAHRNYFIYSLRCNATVNTTNINVQFHFQHTIHHQSIVNTMSTIKILFLKCRENHHYSTFGQPWRPYIFTASATRFLQMFYTHWLFLSWSFMIIIHDLAWFATASSIKTNVHALRRGRGTCCVLQKTTRDTK